MFESPPCPAESDGTGLRRFLTVPYKNMYGSDYIAARYCGFRAPPQEAAGLWMHGWCPSKQNLLYPELLFGVSVSHLKAERYWVATKLQESFLHSQGFPASHAIGLPMVYTIDRRVLRRKGSLLVMPVHSLEESKHVWDAQSYVQAIADLRSYFREIVICVSAHCWNKGHWVSEFHASGFKVIRGADSADPWTLQKMRDLLRAFEFVTTNGFGSHLAYGACFGSKVSIFGTYTEMTAQALSDVPYYRDNPHLLGLELENASYNTNRQRYPSLFCHPAEAKTAETWGRMELGWDNKISPRDMKKLFSWKLVDRLRQRIGATLRRTKGLMPSAIKSRMKARLSPELRRQRSERE